MRFRRDAGAVDAVDAIHGCHIRSSTGRQPLLNLLAASCKCPGSAAICPPVVVLRPLEKVLSRAQLFEVLMGRPDFEPVTDEEEYDDEDRGGVREVDADADATAAALAPLLPENFAEWLRPDLSLESNGRS